MPMLGFGVWQVPDGPECVRSVREALELGYRHIDTAQAYGNEASVGAALRESAIPREEIFVTTKFYPGSKDPAAEAEQSLRRLGIDQVDLYIIHWPQGGPTWAWPGMEAAHAAGHAKSIGVSNFNTGELEALKAVAEIAPAVNQVQFNPFCFRRALLAACEQQEIVLEAYSPLGTGRHLDDPLITAMAERLGRSPAQVLLRWCLERQIPVIPKSTHRQRIEENARIFDFALSEADMGELDGLDETGGTSAAQEHQWW
jgi:2,5-diketo-D-gluconate reductase A